MSKRQSEDKLESPKKMPLRNSSSFFQEQLVSSTDDVDLFSLMTGEPCRELNPTEQQKLVLIHACRKKGYTVSELLTKYREGEFNLSESKPEAAFEFKVGDFNLFDSESDFEDENMIEVKQKLRQLRGNYNILRKELNKLMNEIQHLKLPIPFEILSLIKKKEKVYGASSEKSEEEILQQISKLEENIVIIKQKIENLKDLLTKRKEAIPLPKRKSLSVDKKEVIKILCSLEPSVAGIKTKVPRTVLEKSRTAFNNIIYAINTQYDLIKSQAFFTQNNNSHCSHYLSNFKEIVYNPSHSKLWEECHLEITKLFKLIKTCDTMIEKEKQQFEAECRSFIYGKIKR